jgi:hypothetical protein
MNTALVLVATGKMYHEYARQLIASAKQYFVPHEVCLFTDSDEDFEVYKVKCPTLGYPEATLKRYHLFLTQERALAKFDYVFYVDVDAKFVSSVGQEIFGPDITVVIHKGYNEHTWDWFAEHRPESSAHTGYIGRYYVGGFNGGTSKAFLGMSRAIRDAVDRDDSKGLVARWHDESHMNRYLSEHKPSTVLSIDYGYPETDLEGYKGSPKILFLEKGLGDRTVCG